MGAEDLFELQTGCRLHFGLMELRKGSPLCCAGLGVMLDQPRLRIRIQQAASPHSRRCGKAVSIMAEQELPQLSVVELTSRVDEWVQSIGWDDSKPQKPEVEIVEAFPFHCGLGTGTQLACLLALAGEMLRYEQQRAVGQMLEGWQEPLDAEFRPVGQSRPGLDAPELAVRSKRGQRSGIGVQGFIRGGLILDSGLTDSVSSEAPSRTCSYSMPESWKFVLIRSADSSHITGQRERELMRKVSDEPNPNSELMWQLAGACCDAAKRSNFSGFAENLESYMELASNLFAPVQGDKYNGGHCRSAADLAKSVGLRAVGQSSWGPTIFGLAPDSECARKAAEAIRYEHPHWVVNIATVLDAGAQIRCARHKSNVDQSPLITDVD